MVSLAPEHGVKLGDLGLNSDAATRPSTTTRRCVTISFPPP